MAGSEDDYTKFEATLDKLLQYRGMVRKRYVQILKLDMRALLTKHQLAMNTALSEPQRQWIEERTTLKTEIASWRDRCRMLSLRINELHQNLENLSVKLPETGQSHQE